MLNAFNKNRNHTIQNCGVRTAIPCARNHGNRQSQFRQMQTCDDLSGSHEHTLFAPSRLDAFMVAGEQKNCTAGASYWRQIEGAHVVRIQATRPSPTYKSFPLLNAAVLTLYSSFRC